MVARHVHAPPRCVRLVADPVLDPLRSLGCASGSVRGHPRAAAASARALPQRARCAAQRDWRRSRRAARRAQARRHGRVLADAGLPLPLGRQRAGARDDPVRQGWRRRDRRTARAAVLAVCGAMGRRVLGAGRGGCEEERVCGRLQRAQPDWAARSDLWRQGRKAAACALHADLCRIAMGRHAGADRVVAAGPSRRRLRRPRQPRAGVLRDDDKALPGHRDQGSRARAAEVAREQARRRSGAAASFVRSRSERHRGCDALGEGRHV